MFQEVLKAFIFIFAAEMGDKTQILAMAFATRFPVKKVLLGILIGSFLNHGLAVALGSFLSTKLPINIIQMVAGVAFILFAIWSLKSDEDEDEENPREIKMGPVVTVAAAFFIGELGDKTQLTAITLASDAVHPLFILLGTVTGMVVTGALGIFVGKKLGDKIPEVGIKLISASIFLFFGLSKLLSTLPTKYIDIKYILPFIIILSSIIIIMVRSLLYRNKYGISSKYKSEAKRLYDYFNHIEKDMCKICLGEGYCKKCKGTSCPIGYAKSIVHNSIQGCIIDDEKIVSANDKHFNSNDLIDSLVDSVCILDSVEDKVKSHNINLIRKQLEYILIGQVVEEYASIKKYVEDVSKYDQEISKLIYREYLRRKPLNERITNVGNVSNNTYLIEISEGYLLIDTGCKNQFESFEKKLKKKDIDINDIKYIFITHVHNDHVGFLSELLRRIDAKVILHPNAVDRLNGGKNIPIGGYSSRLALTMYKFFSVINRKNTCFEKVNMPSRYIVLDCDNKNKIESELGCKIVNLPGHTRDSIGIILENKILFCGDATMNIFPIKNKIILWIENVIDYVHSWNQMIELNFEFVYPSHGRPFSKDILIETKDKLSKIKLYPFKYNPPC